MVGRRTSYSYVSFCDIWLDVAQSIHMYRSVIYGWTSHELFIYISFGDMDVARTIHISFCDICMDVAQATRI